MESALPTVVKPSSLLERFQQVRSRTEQLADVLSPEDQTVQSMPDASPTKWHRAHVTWFFETFILNEFESDSQPFDVDFGYLFNSYYEAVGERHPRAERGLVTRPSAAEVGDYRANVDKRMEELLLAVDQNSPLNSDLAFLVELGLHHESQHQELLLMDIKHLLSRSSIEPAYVEREHSAETTASDIEWLEVEGGIITVGCDGTDDHFSFDNENPRHQTLVGDFRFANRLVTCGEWLEFMADGGYERPDLWLSDGWYTAKSNGWTSPEYWKPSTNDSWRVHTLSGTRAVDPNEPVCHVSFYEADAYATWSDSRLPTEFEWELVAQKAPSSTSASTGNLMADNPLTGSLHPLGPRFDASGFGDDIGRHTSEPEGPIVHQLFGDCWEWTGSPYRPYPGFKIADGAIGEYNGKFMINTMVLRGGCAFTPPGHIRSTYRNFFHPQSRWHLSGVRLAGDGQAGN